MSIGTDVREYTSPTRKLVGFFWNSRNQWKQKCQEAKRQNKLLQNQTRAVERSRDQWKELARERAQRLAELERELELEKNQAAHGVILAAERPARRAASAPSSLRLR